MRYRLLNPNQRIPRIVRPRRVSAFLAADVGAEGCFRDVRRMLPDTES